MKSERFKRIVLPFSLREIGDVLKREKQFARFEFLRLKSSDILTEFEFGEQDVVLTASM